jgi:hypothetical protein
MIEATFKMKGRSRLLIKLTIALVPALSTLAVVHATTPATDQLQVKQNGASRRLNFIDDILKWFRGGGQPRKKKKTPVPNIRKPTNAPSMPARRFGAGIGEPCSPIIECHHAFCDTPACPEVRCIDSICKLPSRCGIGYCTFDEVCCAGTTICATSLSTCPIQRFAFLDEPCDDMIVCAPNFCDDPFAQPCPQMTCTNGICILPPK